MATAKSFTELGSIYQNEVLLVENKKQTVGGKQDIGEVKLTTEGGNDKVKKDLETPKEQDTPNGDLKDADKETSKKTKTLKESTMKPKSYFDTIFNQIFSEGIDDLNPGTAAPVQEDDLSDDVPAIPGDESGAGAEEEVIDPAAVLAEIDALVCKLKKHLGIPCGDEGEGSPIGDEGAIDTVAVPPEEPAVGEAVDAKKLADSKGKSLQGAKKSADVGGVKVTKKTADGTATTGDGKLEKAPDGTKMAGDKKAEVKGTSAVVKGGNKSALEE